MSIDWLVDWINGSWLYFLGIPGAFILATLLAALAIFGLVAVHAIVAVYVERKVSAFMQDRIGPMGQGPGLHAGKWGLLQTVADSIKLLVKEDIIPAAADRKLFILAPFILFLGGFIAFTAIPFSQTLVLADFNVGLFFITAVSSFGVLGLILAGWASNNKWSLYGAMRSAAQIISYEIPAAVSLIAVVMLAGTLNMQGLVAAQSGTVLGFLPNWYIFQNPFTFLAFFIYLIAGVAETNRTPFDIPEAESELVAGFHTEYSGMRWAFFFLSEYANMFVVCAVASVVFLGGWQTPVEGWLAGPGWGLFWFFAKVIFLVLVMMWFRWTFPRLRVDQLMNVSWKYLLPLAFFNLFGTGIWSLAVG